MTVSSIVNNNYVLVFDVETSGLLPKKNQQALSRQLTINDYPHIIQFSFILYDVNTNNIVSCYDSLINIPEHVIIPEIVSELTGIQSYMCHYKGDSIVNALIEFEQAYKQCKCIVAHNMDFDMEMIFVEIERNRLEISQRASQCFTLFQPVYERINNIERYCTMRKGTNMCNIITPGLDGKPPRKKWPKLSELYSFLFNGEKAEGLHNSLIDVMVCLKCFLKMKGYDMNISLFPPVQEDTLDSVLLL